MPVNGKRKSELRAASRAIAREIPAPHDPARPDRVELCRLDLRSFCELYFQYRFPLPFSADHRQMISRLQEVILHGGQYAIAMPRGSGKTTLCECACLWALLYGHRQFVFVVCATGDAALSLISCLKSELANNDELELDYSGAVGAIRALGGVSRRAEGQMIDGIGQSHLVWRNDEIRLPVTAEKGGSVIRGAGMDLFAARKRRLQTASRCVQTLF
jgi:hypothetical protein